MGPSTSHDGGADHVAALDIWNRKNDCFLYARIGVNQILYLCRVNIQSAGDNHIVPSAEMVKIAVPVALAHIAGVEPTLANARRSRVRPAKVAFHHMWSACNDFTRLLISQLLPIFIDYFDFDAGHSSPDAAELFLRFIRLYQSDHRRGFSQSIALNHLYMRLCGLKRV